MTLEVYNDVLKARGILEVAQRLGWQDCDWRNEAGWKYPLHTAKGERFGSDSWRWKAVNNTATQRFAWFDKPAGCEYYWSGDDMALQIAYADGWLHITAGESDMMTLIALGFTNVTTFFGEGNIPPSLVDHLEKLNVSRITYWADNDNTGYDDARKINTIFAQSEIEFSCYAPPYPFNDLNDWAVATGFKESPLTACRILKFKEVEQPLPQADGFKLLDVVAYRQAITDALNADWKRADKKGWSKPMTCIFKSHEHDAKRPSAGWNQDNGTYQCFKCVETWQSDDVAAQLGINPDDYRTIEPLPMGISAPGQSITITPPEPIFYDSDQSLERLVERIEGKAVSDFMPIINPIISIHQYGGFARIFKPGKMIGILGLSGGGKTSFLESLIADPLRQLGVSGIWWGPEWSWEEYSDRALQRYGNVTTEDISLHEMWLSEEKMRAAGKPASKYGVRLSNEKIINALETVHRLKSWSGKTYYTQKLDTSLEELLHMQQSKIDELRGQGVNLAYAVWDYIQLAEIVGARSERERIQTAIRKVKVFCVTNRLIGFVASQPTKEGSSQAKSNGDNVNEDGSVDGLGAEAAQFMRDWEFNLFLTLTPAMKEHKPIGWGTVQIVKNSQGRTGEVKLVTDFPRLRWVDEIARGR